MNVAKEGFRCRKSNQVGCAGSSIKRIWLGSRRTDQERIRIGVFLPP